MTKYAALSRTEVTAAVERTGLRSRVPVNYHFWLHPETFGEESETQVRDILENYPDDVQMVEFAMPDEYSASGEYAEYKWIYKTPPVSSFTLGLDNTVLISDSEMSESAGEFIRRFPSPEYKNLTKYNLPDDGRYRLGKWWRTLFERHWTFRGMEGALTDYYDNPAQVHMLFEALTSFYMRLMERGKTEMSLDGIMMGDDLGTQTGPFFSERIFTEFFKPYYKLMIDKAHSLGLHCWIHSCGCIKPFIRHFIDIGLDVLHPIQKYTMDEREIAKEYGKDITFWSGFDVQRIIPFGSPEDVRGEIKAMFECYWRPEGGFILSAGNGINGDCPLDSLRALFMQSFETAMEYAAK